MKTYDLHIYPDYNIHIEHNAADGVTRIESGLHAGMTDLEKAAMDMLDAVLLALVPVMEVSNEDLEEAIQTAFDAWYQDYDLEPDDTIRCPECGNADLDLDMSTVASGEFKFTCLGCGYVFSKPTDE